MIRLGLVSFTCLSTEVKCKKVLCNAMLHLPCVEACMLTAGVLMSFNKFIMQRWSMTIETFKNKLWVKIVHEAFEAEHIVFFQDVTVLFVVHNFYCLVIQSYDRFYS